MFQEQLELEGRIPMLKKNYVLYLLLFVSLAINGYLAIQWRLCREMNEGAGFVIDITVAKSRISPRMTYEDVIARVHHEPDVIKADEGGKLCTWSAYYHPGCLEELLGYTYANGHYYLNVLFDDQGKVLDVSLTEG